MIVNPNLAEAIQPARAPFLDGAKYSRKVVTSPVSRRFAENVARFVGVFVATVFHFLPSLRLIRPDRDL